MKATGQTASVVAGLLISISGWAERAAVAGAVGPEAFTHRATVQRFDNLGYGLQTPGPFVLGPDVYSTRFGIIRYRSDWGALMGRSGGGIGTDAEDDYLEIQLGTPAYRAGLYTGTLFRGGRAEVSFYDANSQLLGTVATVTAADASAFAGWQTDAGLITRVRVTDTDYYNFIVASIDDFIQEPVPEPTGWLVALVAGLGAILARRR